MPGFFSGCTDDQLRSIELFSDLDDGALNEIRSHSHFIGAHPGLKIVSSGDTGFQLHVILTGEAEVRRDDEVVATLGKGDVFGEMAVLSNRSRNADVVATSVMSILSMTAIAFRHVADLYPELESRVRAVAEERLGS